MAIKSARVGRVVFVRWSIQISDEDVPAFDAVMAQAKQDPGPPIFLVSLLPEGIELPPASVQKPLLKRVIRMQHACQSMHAVLEGRGVLQALGRRFLRGMAKMAGLKGAHVNATAEEALKAMPADVLGMTAADILAQARAGGVLG